MRIKLDENLGLDLVPTLEALGHDVEHVYGEGLSGHSDQEVWEAAQSEARFLVTQDVRFADAVFAAGEHHGLLLVRLKRPGARAVAARVTLLFETEEVRSWSGCFVICTNSKVRVRRPSSWR